MEINSSIACAKGNYGSARAASKIKYIVVHYTANKTDTAKANANYFKNNIVKASAHYFVDATSIYQSVTDLSTAWSVGGDKYNDCASTGGGSLYKKVTNTNSISVELCSSNGAFSETTINNAIQLIKSLMNKYSIGIDCVVRHFDVNGKHCPGWSGWYGSDSSKWILFKSKICGTSAVQSSTAETKSTTAAASGAKYKVTSTCGVNIRSGAGANYSKIGAIAYKTIITVTTITGDWGYVPSLKGWICLKYAIKA